MFMVNLRVTGYDSGKVTDDVLYESASFMEALDYMHGERDFDRNEKDGGFDFWNGLEVNYFISFRPVGWWEGNF